MHDIYEGVSRYVMTVVINILLEEGACTLDYLNKRIVEIDYGPDSGNKPPTVTYDKKSVRLGMSSAVCRHFLAYFGLLIGLTVPEVGLDNPRLTMIQKAYKFYILLRKCEEVIMTRRVNAGLAANLRDFISYLNDPTEIPPPHPLPQHASKIWSCLPLVVYAI